MVTLAKYFREYLLLFTAVTLLKNMPHIMIEAECSVFDEFLCGREHSASIIMCGIFQIAYNQILHLSNEFIYQSEYIILHGF
jgi:hypothetical protein